MDNPDDPCATCGHARRRHADHDNYDCDDNYTHTTTCCCEIMCRCKAFRSIEDHLLGHALVSELE